MDLTNKFCAKPFEYLDIHYKDGEYFCYVCCPTWLPVNVGDIGKEGFSSIWNGEKIKEVRQSILNGSFLYCNKELCPEIQSDKLHEKSYIYKSEYKEYLTYTDGVVPHGPRILYFSEDRTCNLACPSCRNDYISLGPNLMEHLKATREGFLTELLKDVESLNICSSGDPFSSKIYRDFLFSFDGKTRPNLKINLNTNGVLLTKSAFQKMEKIHGNLGSIVVSLDAAREETYNIVRRGGDWNKLLQNLKMLVDMRRAGKFEHLQLDFVVQDHNYREMPEFVSLGKELGVDQVYFQRISNWGTFNSSEYDKRNILSKNHPLHQHFKDVCLHPLMREKIVKRGNISRYVPLNSKEKFFNFLKSFKFLRKARKKVLEVTN